MDTGTAAAESPTLFTREGGAFVATPYAASPWSPESLHGGPVAALLAQELEAVPAGGPMFPARLTVELWRPVGLEPYRVDCRVVRPGRRVQVLEATLARRPDQPPSPETIVARATLQRIAAGAVVLPGVPAAGGPDEGRPPDPDDLVPTSSDVGVAQFDEGVRFHRQGVEHRATHALFGAPGAATDWIRVRADLVPGTPPGPLARVAAAADFGNGISRVLPFEDFTFVNPDLTIHLYRLPVDEWVCLDAVTRIDPDPGAGSVALAESALFDRRGRIGRSLQSLLVAPTR
jgi:acyl-coenzyme A thioesterase PaaI-like protein